MELDVALECENFQPGFKPEIAYRLLGSPRGDKWEIKDKTRGKYHELKILDGGLTELSLSDSASPHRRSMPSRTVAANVEDSEVHKRGSVYHSSREIMKMRKQRDRKKNLELVDNKETFLSFEIHSLSRSNQDEQILNPQQKRSPLISLNTEKKSSSSTTSQTVLTNCNEFLDLSFRHLPEEQSDLKVLCSGFISPENCSAHAFPEATLKRRDNKFRCGNGVLDILEYRLDEESEHKSNQILGSENDGNIYHETDAMFTFTKSFSAKVGTLAAPHTGKGYLKGSTKPRVSPLRKMFDPIMKSKSMRSSSLIETENAGCATTNPASIRKNMGLRKFLANEFANAAEKAECDESPIGGGQVLNAGALPTHLHGTVKLELKHGEPSFEFSMKDPDLQLSAKTWKTDSAFNWVYTFHGKKSSSMGWKAKDRHRLSSPIIGQMNVSCYLCSEMSDDSYLDNSMVTEFVLYDIGLARRSSLEERCHCSSECLHVPDRTSANSLVASCSLDANSIEQEKCKRHVKHAFSDCDEGASAAYPWAPADLHPQLEIAAIVIQAPFCNREGSKAVQMDEIKNKECPIMLSAPVVDLGRDALNASTEVKVVTPTGRHGLPNIEEGGPSSLLARWRSGGSCDCGGWDMGCPIVVFDNTTRAVANHSKHGTQESMMLFIQGKKEKVPALSMTDDGKGVYLIQFHAQLSAIQAFSICIAMLHGSEPSVTGEENRLKLYSNPLKLLLEEEVRSLVEVVAKEEKQTPTKKVEHIPPSFILDPPFSPMGRV